MITRILRNAGDQGGAPAAAPADAPQPAAPAAAPAPAPSAAAAAPAPAAAPAAAPAEKAPPKWLSQLSPDRQARKELYDFESLNHVADELVKRKTEGERTIVVPDPKTATPEQIQAFRQQMGIPADPKEYEFDLGELAELDDIKRLSNTVKQAAFASGATRKQASTFMTAMLKTIADESNIQETRKAEQQAGFDKAVLDMYGGDQAKADAMKGIYRAALIRFNDADFVRALGKSGKLYDPAFARKLAEYELYIGDDQLPSAGRPPAPPAPSGTKSNGAFGSSYSSDWNAAHGGK